MEPYQFQVEQTERDIVISGLLTDKPGAHQVSISYTYPIDQETNIPISGAAVWIQDSDGFSISLEEASPGNYQTVDDFYGVAGKYYTLYVENAGGKNYQSSPQIMPLPAKLDSLYGKYEILPSSVDETNDAGVQLYMDSYQETDSIFNYRFEYLESYQMRVPVPSLLDWEGTGPSFRVFPRPKSVETCYRSGRPGSILLTTTKGQVEPDVIEYPLQFIPQSGPQLLFEYAIEVKQYSLSEETYEYYRTLKEVNESGGSFFDKQKGTIYGNLFEAGAPENAILGYFEVAGESSSSRRFKPEEFVDEGLTTVNPICNTPTIDSISILREFSITEVDLNGNTTINTFTSRDWSAVDGFLHNPSDEGPSMNIIDTTYNYAYLTYKFCSDCQLWGFLDEPDIWK